MKKGERERERERKTPFQRVPIDFSNFYDRAHPSSRAELFIMYKVQLQAIIVFGVRNHANIIDLIMNRAPVRASPQQCSMVLTHDTVYGESDRARISHLSHPPIEIPRPR